MEYGVPLPHYSIIPSLHFSLQRLYQSIAHFIDVPGAESKRDIAGNQFFTQPFSDLSLIRDEFYLHVTVSFDGLVERFAAHLRNRIFTGAVNFRQHEPVGAVKGGYKVVKEIARSALAVRLKNHR